MIVGKKVAGKSKHLPQKKYPRKNVPGKISIQMRRYILCKQQNKSNQTLFKIFKLK